MRGLLHTAGERVELTCAVPWIADILTEGAAGQLTAADGTTPDVRVTVERGSAAFDVTGWRVLTRGAWCRQGQVVIWRCLLVRPRPAGDGGRAQP